MGPKRSGGVSKGKHPAKKRAPSRPPVAISSSDEDDGFGGNQDLWDRLEALERARGLASATTVNDQQCRHTRAASRAQFRANFASRLSLLEGSLDPGASTSTAAVEVQAGPREVAEAQPTGDAAEASWQEDVRPVAVVVQPTEAEDAVGRRRRLRILICGHSMVFWVAHQARRTPIGSQLGLSQWATIEWLGRRGMKWAGLLNLLFGEKHRPPPDILVIHLGGNDLGLLKGKALSLQAEADLHKIRDCWPQVLLFWSAMLPRRVWRDARDPRAVDKARRKANGAIFKALSCGLGIYLPHPQIRAKFADLYRGDGVHLSGAGNDIFLEDIRQGLRVALSHVWGVQV